MWNFPVLCCVVTDSYLVMPRTSSRPTWMTDDSGASGSFQNFHNYSHEPQDQDSLGKKTMRDQILPLQQEPAFQWSTISCSADRMIERKESLWSLLHWGQAVMTFLHSLAGSLCKTDAISFAKKADNKHLQLNQADELDPATTKHPAGFDSNPHKFTAQLGRTLPCGQGAHSLVSGSCLRWILSAFHSFLKTQQNSLQPTRLLTPMCTFFIYS